MEQYSNLDRAVSAERISKKEIRPKSQMKRKSTLMSMERRTGSCH
jgi:hypothetical protein